jgi:hypothetical protein
LAGCAAWPAGSPPEAAASLHRADEAEIRAYLQKDEAETPFVRSAPDLDWENAFGIRYNDLAKRDAFYGAVVAPLQVGDTGGTLEVRVHFLGPSFAVADEYWREVGQRDADTFERGPDRWGRTTYIFEKAGGKWTEVMERVADLRMAYYRHYDALPAPAPLPEATLIALEGTFRFPRRSFTLSRAGDHFAIVRRSATNPAETKAMVGIPISSSSVLLFDPKDLAEYLRLDFSDGVPTITRSGDDPAVAGTRGARVAQ